MSKRDDSGTYAHQVVGAVPDYAQNPEALFGRVIDNRYRITSFIGQGGMGAVFAAEHVTIRRPVAVKILHPAMAQVPEIVRRFEREAFAIGRIDHPNCVNVSDFGKLEDGSLYLVMEFLDGKALDEVIDQGGPMATGRALTILRHMLSGLGHAHKAGIVHRDIKPENVVLVENDGDKDFAKILDFGIAKLVGDAQQEEDHKLTQAGIAFGTPTYMSPEQTIGDPVDPRADLYSATVVFYELIAGRAPFRSDDKLELMGMHAAKPPPPVTEFNPRAVLDPGVEELLALGLGKRPEDRFESAHAYIATIDQILMEMSGISVLPRAHTGSDAEASPYIRHPSGAHMIEPGRVSYDKSGPVPLSAEESAARVTGAMAVGRRHSTQNVLPVKKRSGSRRNLILVIAIVASAAALGAVAFFASSMHGDSPASDQPNAAKKTAAAEEEMVDPRSELARAGEALLANGNPQAAYELLQKAGDAIDSDADAQLVLGHALAIKSRGKEAIAAYRRVLDIDESQKFDTEMHANLAVLFNDKKAFSAAAKMLILDLDDEGFRQKLLDRTVHSKSGEWRHLALAVAEDVGIGEQVNRRRLYTLDLEQGTRCADRKRAVAKLRALGNVKAIPALKKAKKRRGTKGRLRRRKINTCLIGDANKAIQYLRTLAANK